MVFSSNGKLLLTAEYLVLDGAKALALPTTYGQQLDVIETEDGKISWQSFDENKQIWFQDDIKISDLLSDGYSSKNEITNRLIQILKAVNTLNPFFFDSDIGFNIKTHQDFNRKWGLGTSSTLINNIANWTKVNAYQLLHLTFGGSGYDIACAQNNSAITYQILEGSHNIETIEFNPKFKDSIYFVYLNQKQNSREGIANYRKYKEDLQAPILEMNSLTDAIINSEHLSEFEDLVFNHETLISKIINQKTVKDTYFPDFKGGIKSLGAWGGDFVMVTSQENPERYFNNKGFKITIPYSKIIRQLS